MVRIYYGGRSARGVYTHMHKNQSVTKKAGYVAPLLEKPVFPPIEEPKKTNMNKVIEKLEKMQMGGGRPPKKRITFTF